MLILLKIGVFLEADQPNDEYLDEIGQYIATDLHYALENGEDFVKTTYLGSEICENP